MSERARDIANDVTKQRAGQRRPATFRLDDHTKAAVLLAAVALAAVAVRARAPRSA